MTVLDWLLDSDPAIRWQGLRDLTDAPAAEVAAQRQRVTSTGWGAELLAARDPDGQWAGGACFPSDFRGDFSAGQPWTSTFPSLCLLREFGVDPTDPELVRAVDLVAAHCHWEYAGEPFFAGEVEPCINGRAVAVGAYFGVDVSAVVERLLGEQLDDGGWNCEVENGSVVSSFATTLCVLDGLAEYERRGGRTDVTPARHRAEEYLLRRRLFRRLSTGEPVDPSWLLFSFPSWWHYDVLRALDYFRAVGERPDGRVREAVDLVRAKRRLDGTWSAENTHPGAVHFRMELDGEPGRWNTLRALRVLRWYDGLSTPDGPAA